MSDQRSSDPIPFLQLDRATTAGATRLANALGLTTQHTVGSLVDFWWQCSDPRDLEKVIASTPKGQEPELILPRETIELRFKLSSNAECSADLLASLGFLEARENGYRVRGMSRQFGVIAARLRCSEAGKAGGKASAKARKEALGTAQPQHRTDESRSGSRSNDAQALSKHSRSDAEATPKHSRSTPEATVEGSLEHRRSDAEAEYRVQSTETGKETFAGMTPAGAPEALELTAPTDQPTHPKKPKATPTDPRLAPLTERLAQEYEEARGVPYAHGGARDTQALKSLLPLADDEEISARWRWAIVQPSNVWACVSSFAQLRHKWNDIAASANPAQPRGSLHVVRHFEGDILRGAS